MICLVVFFYDLLASEIIEKFSSVDVYSFFVTSEFNDSSKI